MLQKTISEPKSMRPIKQKIGLISLLVVVLIDGLGASMVLPLLPQLFGQESSFLSNSAYNSGLSHFYLAMALAAFPLGMFFGAPALGRLSDIFGRKTAIIYCLVGTLLGYLICGISIAISNPWLFIFGRLLDGITAGSLPVAQALIIENRAGVNKQANIGLALFFAVFGYMLGPMIAPMIERILPKTHGSLDELIVPFYFVSMLSLIGLMLLKFVIEENQAKKEKIVQLSFFRQFIPNIRLKNVGAILLLFTLFQLGWSGYFQHISIYLASDLYFSVSQTSSVLSIIGLGMGIAFCYLVGKVSPLFKLKQLIPFSGLVVAISLALTLLIHSFFLVCLFGFLAALGYGLGYPNIVAYLSSQADEKSQGFIFGLAASVSSLSAFFTALLGAVTNMASTKTTLWVNICFSFCFILLSLALFGYFRFLSPKKEQQEEIKTND